MSLRYAAISLVFSLWLCGCGSGGSSTILTVVPVHGLVTLNGTPLVEADVTAIPAGTTPGLGGTGRTNGKGEFELQHHRGEAGLPPGEYKLTVSLRKRPDGSIPSVDDPTPPIESDAVETLPPKYSNADATTLTWKIPEGGLPIELKLEDPTAGK